MYFFHKAKGKVIHNFNQRFIGIEIISNGPKVGTIQVQVSGAYFKSPPQFWLTFPAPLATTFQGNEVVSGSPLGYIPFQ